MLKRFFVVLLCTFFIFPTFANANERNKYLEETNMTWSPTLNSTFEPLTEKEIEQNNELDKMMNTIKKAYIEYYNGKISIDELMTIEKEQYSTIYLDESEINSFLNKESSIKNIQNRLFSLNENDYFLYAIGDGESVYLPMPYEYQNTIYNCGPASAVNVVNGYNGFTYFTQSRAASLLGTTTNGTNFGTNWNNVLNSQTMRKRYTRTFGSNYNNWPMVLADRTITTIRSRRGVILDTYMYNYDTYLPGYTSGVIYHYVAGYGFNSTDPSRRYISYIDPNQYNAAAAGAKTVSYQQMARATKGMGIIT